MDCIIVLLHYSYNLFAPSPLMNPSHKSHMSPLSLRTVLSKKSMNLIVLVFSELFLLAIVERGLLCANEVSRNLEFIASD
jgi:hypothetical protein